MLVIGECKPCRGAGAGEKEWASRRSALLFDVTESVSCKESDSAVLWVSVVISFGRSFVVMYAFKCRSNFNVSFGLYTDPTARSPSLSPLLTKLSQTSFAVHTTLSTQCPSSVEKPPVGSRGYIPARRPVNQGQAKSTSVWVISAVLT